MSRKRIFRLLAVIPLAALIGLGLWELTNRPETISELLIRTGLRREKESALLRASGFIEADQVVVASELGGRVIRLSVDEGDAVVAGQPLLVLDTTLLDARIAAAAAALDVAQAEAGQVAAAPRSESLAVAQAQVTRARAVQAAARRAWQSTVRLRDDPQELELEITAARARLAVAEEQFAQAQALRDAAEVGYDRFNQVMEEIGPAQRVEVANGPLAALAPFLQSVLPPDVYQAVMSGADGTYSGGGYEVVVTGGHATVYKSVPLQFDFHLLPNRYWQAGTGVNVAQAARDGAWASLSHLYTLRDDPQAADARVDTALEQFRAAQASVEAAAAALTTLEAGATPQELELAQARVAAAQSALSTLETRRSLARVTAPRDGVVAARQIAIGELAGPAMPLLTIADLSQVTLTLYVPVEELDRVHLGQPVVAEVDAFPGRRFRGSVTYIAPQAQFTPSATQTEEQRTSLVFPVRVHLPNPDGALKPGIPADATFMEGEGG
jgi:multidrug efflux pump subunit AcrA (membrane-fusion protein)